MTLRSESKSNGTIPGTSVKVNTGRHVSAVCANAKRCIVYGKFTYAVEVFSDA